MTGRPLADSLVVTWHARGLSDREAAAALGVCRQTVFNARKRLGLPANRRPPTSRAPKPPGRPPSRQPYVARSAWRSFAGRITGTDVRVLNTLAAAGVPMTAAQIAAVVGVNPSHSGDKPMARLRRLGLAVAVGRVPYPPGRRGAGPYLFALTPDAWTLWTAALEAPPCRSPATT